MNITTSKDYKGNARSLTPQVNPLHKMHDVILVRYYPDHDLNHTQSNEVKHANHYTMSYYLLYIFYLCYVAVGYKHTDNHY